MPRLRRDLWTPWTLLADRAGLTAAAASRITSVTASGCEIMITWEPSTSVILAPARSAIERTTSVPAALSPVATTAQDGRSSRPAARSARRTPTRRGPLGGCDQRGLLVGEVAGEGVADLRRVDVNSVPSRRSRSGSPGHQRAVQDAVLRARLDLAEGLAFFGGKRGDVDETDDVLRVGRGVRDHRAAVGVADGEHRSCDLREDRGDVGGVGGIPRSGFAGRRDLHALVL